MGKWETLRWQDHLQTPHSLILFPSVWISVFEQSDLWMCDLL